ncbi:MAG: hypothetical protein ACT4PG_01780 [Panacagrimonas sp.]
MLEAYEEALLRKIRSGEFNADELRALYRNAEAREKENVMEEVVKALRTEHPRVAARMFGPREAGARAKLEEALVEIRKAIDLSDNQRGSHVMIGGGMFDGSLYVDVYIAYRSKNGKGTSLGIVQETADSTAFPRVGRSHLGASTERKVQNFTLENFDAALAAYLVELRTIVVERA